MGRVDALIGRVAERMVGRNWRDWVGLAARLILGIGLFYAGAIKIGRLESNVTQVALYQLPIPDWMVTLVGYAQPFVEIAVGLLLIIGLFTRISAALGTIAMVVFIGGIAWAWSQGLQIDCGCFSIGGELPEGAQTKYVQDILRDLGMMACGIWLWVRPASAIALDTWLLAPPAVRHDYSYTDSVDEDDESISGVPTPEMTVPVTDEKATR